MQIGSSSYMKVKIEHSILKTLDSDHVFVMDHRNLCRDYPVRYFKNMKPEVDIMTCLECQQFFIIEEFDMHFNMKKTCAFCSSKNIA